MKAKIEPGKPSKTSKEMKRTLHLPVDDMRRFWHDLDQAICWMKIYSDEMKKKLYLYKTNNDHYSEYWILDSDQIGNPESPCYLYAYDGGRLLVNTKDGWKAR